MLSDLTLLQLASVGGLDVLSCRLKIINTPLSITIVIIPTIRVKNHGLPHLAQGLLIMIGGWHWMLDLPLKLFLTEYGINRPLLK